MLFAFFYSEHHSSFGLKFIRRSVVRLSPALTFYQANEDDFPCHKQSKPKVLEMQRIASNGSLLCQVNSQWRMEVGNAIRKEGTLYNKKEILFFSEIA